MQDTPPTDSDYDLTDFLAPHGLQTMIDTAWTWGVDHLANWGTGIQLLIICGAIIPAAFFSPALKAFCANTIEKHLSHGLLRRLANAMTRLALPISILMVLTISMWVMDALDQRTELLNVARSLLVAWVVIRAVTLAIRSSFWSKFAFFTVWPLAALNAFGLLDDLMHYLSGIKITLNEGNAAANIPATELSALDFIRALIIFVVIFAIARLFSGLAIRQIDKAAELSPSLKAMLAKIINLITPVFALLIALQMIQFNLASLTILGGAIGLGVGLGLQNLVANFTAGMTLLMDKSIKPGDTVEIENTYGWVTAMKTRFVAIRTRDGDDHLIPNDHFMTSSVINRSHGDPFYRIHAPIGVAYGTEDLALVQKICLEAVAKADRALAHPEPACLLTEFGDSSVNFDIRFWIKDPRNGIANVRSDVLMAVWEGLKEHNIEIPFPQRDLHLKSGFDQLAAGTKADLPPSDV